MFRASILIIFGVIMLFSAVKSGSWLGALIVLVVLGAVIGFLVLTKKYR